MAELVSDVFKTAGQPSTTYVERDSGNLERKLSGYLDEHGVLCLITGPSKTGKTTLYKKVLADRGQVPLVVRCTRDRTTHDIWLLALEAVDFDRVTSTSSKLVDGKELGVSGEGKLGWQWLAGITGKASALASNSKEEAEIRERVLASPSPDLIIPILQRTNYVLVIEDFHYLKDNEKVALFEQWKQFIDNEVTVIFLGTTHRAVDIAVSNRDISGRIAQIDVTEWSGADLRRICSLGMEYLKCTTSASVIEKIAAESVGLPIITQQICLALFYGKNIQSVTEARKRRAVFNAPDLNSACHEVAKARYAHFNTYYDAIVRGPREKARKYKTYELVIACFTADPIQFSLTRSEIDVRLGKVLPPETPRPPAASVNSTLGALKDFQDRRDFELLEWRSKEDRLYIVEPSFLFYVRWRKDKNAEKNKQLDLFETLIVEAFRNASEWTLHSVRHQRRS